MSSADCLDVIIFGATGFTGAATVAEAVRLLDGLRWGIAGRNEAKLRALLQSVGQRLQRPDLADSVEIVVADIGDEKSLRQMANRTRLVVNCAGPYRHFGEPVTKACIAGGAHQVDVSGEPQYIERMQLDYDEAARSAGVYLVSACGFDSIPADMGTLFAERQFQPAGECNAIESYLRVWFRGGRPSGAGVNFGTWESAVEGLAHWSELKPLRRRLFADKPLPELKPRLPRRAALHRAERMGGRWAVPFMGADRSVVLRSQRVLLETQHKRPIQLQTYLALDSWLAVVGLMLFGGVFALLARFEWGRGLLLRHPRLFSGGLFSREGPSEETQKATWFSETFVATGWSRKAADQQQQPRELPDKTVVTRVTACNPGYGATVVAVLLAATTILRETDQLPGKGGVLPPGGAFAKTTLIEQLSQNGYTFEVLEGDKDK